LTLATVVVVLILVTAAAAWVPAHRAGRLDPARVLRTD
jgi:ABC-type lipoprotein release transport system permease subunit